MAIELLGAGCPSTLTKETHNAIIDAVPKVLVQNQIAALAGVPISNLSYWLKRGREDQKEGKTTIYSNLLNDYSKAKAEHLYKILTEIQTCRVNYGALTWTLEKCFREDFGADSEEMKQLRELFVQILPLLGKGFSDGKEIKEVDKESN